MTATLADDCSFVIAFVVDQDLVLVQHVSMIVAHRPYHAMAFQVFASMIKQKCKRKKKNRLHKHILTTSTPTRST